MTFIKDHKHARLYRRICSIALSIAAFFLLTQLVFAKSLHDPGEKTAVVFVYQRVGEDNTAQGNLSLEQFQEHMRELTTNGYSVLPLDDIIETLKTPEKELPKKTIALTFDGAYSATLNNVLPILQDARFPFTVFFSSDMAEGDTSGHMTWKEIRSLKKNKLVTLGLMPSAYTRLAGKSADENAALINKAISRFREELNSPATFMAYPYGEYSKALKKQIEGYSFKAVFGQQSGVLSETSDFLALPRFTMTDEFGDLDRFLLTANALPLHVTDLVPDDVIINENPPLIGFTLDPAYKDNSKLSCFVSGLGKVNLTRLGNNRIEIRLPAPLTDRHTRVNCTMPNDLITPGEPRQWRWFGVQLILPNIAEDDAETIDNAGSGESPGTPENQ